MNKIVNISTLRNWDKNPRNISKKDFERLKKQITELGQYKPLLITEDGEVLGGNMRLRAYNELGIKDIWVSVVTPKDEDQKLAYALSDNDRAGYYDADAIANMMPDYSVDWSLYSVDFKEPQTIQELLSVLNAEPVAFDDDERLDEKKKIICPECGHEFEN